MMLVSLKEKKKLCSKFSPPYLPSLLIFLQVLFIRLECYMFQAKSISSEDTRVCTLVELCCGDDHGIFQCFFSHSIQYQASTPTALFTNVRAQFVIYRSLWPVVDVGALSSWSNRAFEQLHQSATNRYSPTHRNMCSSKYCGGFKPGPPRKPFI